MTTWTEFYSQIRDPAWPECATEEQSSWRYLQGIAKQRMHRGPNVLEITKLFVFF